MFALLSVLLALLAAGFGPGPRLAGAVVQAPAGPGTIRRRRRGLPGLLFGYLGQGERARDGPAYRPLRAISRIAAVSSAWAR